eukprot:5319924-Karenia_brevis.AAC.1
MGVIGRAPACGNESKIRKRPAGNCTTGQTVKRRPAAAVAATVESLPEWPGPVHQDADAIMFNGYRIYTEFNTSKYRVKKVGVRQDKAFSFKRASPEQVWEAVREFLRGTL